MREKHCVKVQRFKHETEKYKLGMWTRGNFQKGAMITGDVQMNTKYEDVNSYSYVLLIYQMLLQQKLFTALKVWDLCAYCSGFPFYGIFLFLLF